MSAYNAEAFVAEAINSILNQSFQDFELLIADDGSSDKTKAVIDSFSDHRVMRYHNGENLGKTPTINKLFAFSAGEYLTIHDADDFSDPNRFDAQIRFLDDNEDYGMCGTSFSYVFYKSKKVFKREVMPTHYDEIVRDIRSGSQFHGPTMVFRKKLISGDQLLRPFFEDYHEDCDLSYRLVQQAKATNLQEILYQYRLVPGSLSKELTPRKRVLYHIVALLANQREDRGYDDLERNDTSLLNEELKRFLEPYQNDPSKIHIENAEFQMYFQMYWSAINSSIKALMTKPNIKSLRTLGYCLRKFILDNSSF